VIVDLNKPLSWIKLSRSTLSKLWYLLHISSKYNLDLNAIYQSLIDASTQKLRTCGPLTIEYRGESEDSLIFLLTDRSGNTEGQLRIPQTILKDSMFQKILARHSVLEYQESQYHDFIDQFLKRK
jgi:hypothetical protein